MPAENFTEKERGDFATICRQNKTIDELRQRIENYKASLLQVQGYNAEMGQRIAELEGRYENACSASRKHLNLACSYREALEQVRSWLTQKGQAPDEYEMTIEIIDKALEGGEDGRETVSTTAGEPRRDPEKAEGDRGGSDRAGGDSVGVDGSPAPLTEFTLKHYGVDRNAERIEAAIRELAQRQADLDAIQHEQGCAMVENADHVNKQQEQIDALIDAVLKAHDRYCWNTDERPMYELRKAESDTMDKLREMKGGA